MRARLLLANGLSHRYRNLAVWDSFRVSARVWSFDSFGGGSETVIRLFGEVQESITDGPGIRYAIFTQGCPHYCVGCHNPESHSFTDGYLVEADDIIRRIRRNPLLDGITLSGGEPFMQADELWKVAKAAQEAGLSVITFSGYTFEELLEHATGRKGYTELLSYTDILIDGKFEIEHKSLDLRFRGSTNQRAIDVQKSLEEGRIVLYDL